ncbi:MAG: GGDEF domain-containing protein, partial [Clostridia bacterium]|nr:GGDEF domain-containing protein [Clostridia bacterium]
KTRRFMIDEVVLPREAVISEMGGCFSFIIIDIDNFKYINDAYGHKYGDFTLQAIAATLQCMIRKSDVVARFGGDEFMIFLDNIGVKDSREIAERIRTTVSEIEIEGGIKTTISMGVVTVVRGHTKGYLRMADLCLIQAKEQGRNKVVSYEIDFDRTKRSNYEGM